jgi:hypothetical protein
MLSSAAERLDPAEPRRKSWRKPVAVALTVAASVTAALARNRTKAGNETTAEAEQEPAQAVSAPGGQAS